MLCHMESPKNENTIRRRASSCESESAERTQQKVSEWDELRQWALCLRPFH